MLQSHEGWEVCVEAHTGREAVARTEKQKPDVAILDISMPDLNGVEAAKRIRKVSPKTEVLILSMHYSDQLIRDILEAGVRGYIVKSDSDRDLTTAVESLANHKPFFTARATEVMLSNFNKVKPKEAALEDPGRSHLTPREREIIQLVAEGKRKEGSAARLGLAGFVDSTLMEFRLRASRFRLAPLFLMIHSSL